MNNQSFYLSTIADVTEDERTLDIAYRFYTAPLASKHGLGLELAEYCISANMEDDTAVRPHFDRNVLSNQNLLMHAPYNELLPHAIDPAAERLAYERYSKAYEIAVKNGCKKLIVHLNYCETLYHPLWVVPRQISFWKRFLSEHKGDVQICLENVIEQSPELFKRIIDGTGEERLQMCLDVGHANLTPLAPEKWIQECAGYISHFHLHNNAGKAALSGAGDTHSDLDKGSIPMRELLDRANTLTPNASFTLECYSFEGSIDWLKKEGFIK